MWMISLVLMFSPPPEPGDPYASARAQLVERHLKARDITDPHVLEAMGRVPRHALVPEAMRSRAYEDRPLPIGQKQTISQPYIVALMTQLVGARPGMKILDVGTGSGYQAAVLAEIVDHVYSVEIVCPLADRARADLKRLDYKNVTVRCGDGWQGWLEHAPFDGIILAAAPKVVPKALTDQLRPGAKLVLPVGDDRQALLVIEKQADGTLKQRKVADVIFVPMTGAGPSPTPSPNR